MDSCEKPGGILKDAPLRAGNSGSAFTGTRDQAAHGSAAILVKGNGWVSGIPGFGTNAFRALAGAYRLDGADTAENAVTGKDAAGNNFNVFVTGELLYFSGEWQAATAGNMQAYQLYGADGFVEALILEDSKGVFRTVVFQVPQGLDSGGITAFSFSRMLPAWAGKFLYFASQADSAAEISLPAVVEF